MPATLRVSPIVVAGVLFVALGALALEPAVADSELATRPPVHRVAAHDRVGTAVGASRLAWPTSETVVIARSDDPADALAGTSLAGVHDAPLLITPPDGLDERVADEVDRLGASKAILLGGSAALSTAVEDDLRAAGVPRIMRVAGSSRFSTAAAIADQVEPVAGGTAFLVGAWPDALGTAGLAAHKGRTGRPWPVLLTGADLPMTTRDALERHDVSKVVIVGGSEAVPEAVAAQIRAIGLDVSRIAGASRYTTSLQTLQLYPALPTTIVIATGGNFPDGLAAGALAGRLDAALLLVPPTSVDVDQRDGLRGRAFRNVIVVGGTNAVTEISVDGLVDVLERLPADAGEGGPGAAPTTEPSVEPAPETSVSHGAQLTAQTTGLRSAGYHYDSATDSFSHPDHGALQPVGSFTTTHDGQVIEGVDVSGSISVAHDDVTLRNCRVRYAGTDYAIDAKRQSPRGTTIEHCDITTVGNQAHEAFGVYISDGTVRWTNIERVQVGVFVNGSNTRVEYTRVADLQAISGTHGTGMSANQGASNLTFSRNYIEGNTSAALALYAHSRPFDGVTVADNLFDGGRGASFCLNAGNNKEGEGRNANIQITGNVFTRTAFPECGQYGPYYNWDATSAGAKWCNNRWADSQTPVGSDIGC